MSPEICILRTGMIGREVERRRSICELGFPIIELLIEHAVEPLALPDRKIDILSRKFGKRGRLAGGEGFIEFSQFIEQNAA